MLSSGPNPSEILLLGVDQDLLESALLEAILFHDQLLGLRHVPPPARALCRRSLRRLIYFYRHFHAGERSPGHELRLLESHHPALARLLYQVPEQSHQQVRRALDPVD